MNKKINNKKLLLILVVLVGIFLMTNYIKNNHSTTTVNTDLVHIDTNTVSKIIIRPTNGNQEEVTLLKQNNEWEVKSEEITSKVKGDAIKQVLLKLAGIKIKRLVAKTADKWMKYQVTDSLATHLQVEETGKGKTLDIYLGKIKHHQPNRGYNQFGRGSKFAGSTYIRFANDPSVYEADGFLTMTFNQGFNSWRKDDFIKTNKADITQIQFEDKHGDNFTLMKNDSIWNIEDESIDSIKIDLFLNLLANKQNTNFSDNYASNSTPDYRLTVRGKNMNELQINCFEDTLTNHYYMESSLNPNVFFKSDSSGLFKQLFVQKDYFIK